MNTLIKYHSVSQWCKLLYVIIIMQNIFHCCYFEFPITAFVSAQLFCKSKRREKYLPVCLLIVVTTFRTKGLQTVCDYFLKNEILPNFVRAMIASFFVNKK